MAQYLAPVTPDVSRQETEHRKLVRQLAPQGMVLLENRGVLPLAGPCEVALFGAGVRHTVKGGTGSGDVNSRETVSVEQGFRNAGFRILTGAWLDEYDARLQKAREEHRALLQRKKAEDPNANFILLYFEYPFVNPDTPEIGPALQEAANAELAVYVLSRNSGEGKDRRAEPGDYLLSEREKEDLRLLRAHYPRLVVLLNVGGVMDTAFFREELGADALLLMSQAGADSGDAVVDCLLGITPPSGRLTDTWPLQYGDYPSAATFGSNDGNTDVEPYGEGIFVGYRYFDTFGKEVAYPFGYGLDYSDYRTEAGWVEADRYGVTAKVKVVNTGSHKGRQVVQLYVTPPAGGLEKPHQVLVAFAKTRLLDPGDSQTLTVSFPLKNMASYCPACASWVLEPGKYYLRLARHSRSSRIVAAVEVPERTVLEVLKDLLPLQQPLQELSRAGAVPISYPEEAAEMAAAPVCTVSCEGLETRIAAYRTDDGAPVRHSDAPITMEDLLAGRFSPRDLAAQLTDEELAALCVGSGGSQSVIGAASVSVPGAAGETVSLLLEERGVKPLILADGPAGLRLTPHFQTDAAGNIVSGGGFFAAVAGLEGLDSQGAAPEVPADARDYYQYCTAIPIATLIAQSWDPELARQLGRMVGAEMQKFGVSLWLAPGMNIHRNALCGRNFEYYSEDPLLSGLMAAADTLGVQSIPGVGTTPKHFACNNQEDNRNFSDSVVSLRALREIYLRGFEICVRSAQPMSIMTSYNLINGTHAANLRDLLTHILRDEWGFEGFVMTDWGTTGSGEMPLNGVNSTPSLCIEAGNDLIMPGGPGDRRDILAALKGETAHELSRDSLVSCAARILTVIRDSHLYGDSKPWTGRFRTEWFLAAE